MITFSMDNKAFRSKPCGADIAKINNRIAKNICRMSISEIATEVGENGRTWCPAVFTNNKRSMANFAQAQLIALDFDEGITFDEVKSISDTYNLPMSFAYETFSSECCDRFRVVFRLDAPITDNTTYKNAVVVLMTIFDKCDASCKDSARMFFGGKKVICFNQNNFITLESLEMNLNKYARDKNGATHADRFMRTFAKEHKIDINRHNSIVLGGKKSTFADDNINTNVEKLPCKKYRKNILNKLNESCQLYNEFISDSEWLYYNELNGIALNLNHVETGSNVFLTTIVKSQYDTYKRDWEYYLKYYKKNQYFPMQCDSFCPYRDICQHNTNMINTAHVNRKEIVRIRQTEYVSLEEAQDAVKSCFIEAMNASDNFPLTQSELIGE